MVTIDRRLIDKAEQSEGIAVVEGLDDEGRNVMVLVATGAMIGLIKKYSREGNLCLNLDRTETVEL